MIDDGSVLHKLATLISEMTIAAPDMRKHFINEVLIAGHHAANIVKGANQAAYAPLKNAPGARFCQRTIRVILRVGVKLMKSITTQVGEIVKKITD